MQDTERQKFEENWKKAFDGAESTPPDHVWNSIELDLAGQESASMKKKVVFYQRLAAAMLLFAMTAGVYGYYSGRRTNNDVKREAGNVQRLTDDRPVAKSEGVGDNSLIRKEAPIATTEKVKRNARQQQHAAQPHDLQQQVAFAGVTEPVEGTQPEGKTGIVPTEVAPIVAARDQEETKQEEKREEVVAALLQQLEGPEEVVEPRRSKKQKENLWLALGGSAGNYTPNTPTATTPTISPSAFALKGPALDFSAVAAPRQQPKVGSSYSVGVGVGKRFGRFVLQTGVNLNKQQINYVSNYDAHTASNTTQAAMSDYIGQNSGLTFTNEYTVSSTMDIVSIPLQLGYMIIDRRLGWQVNVGGSNDFFLRNVLVDKSGQRRRFTQEAGSESPYRSVNWSALASTELSYRIGQHYRISLVPGARYSFHSILKKTNDSGRPIILDAGFRFRYIF
jgi:hypothetical protein